jgi:diphthine synthase
VREQSLENMARGRLIYEAPRFMTVGQALEQMLEVEERRAEGALAPSAIAIGVARLGTAGQVIRVGTIAELCAVDFGEPLHSVVIPAPTLHPLEVAFLEAYAVDPATFRAAAAAAASGQQGR